MKLDIREEGYSKERVKESIQEIMEKTELRSLSTVDERRPHIATAFFTFDEGFNLYIATDPETEHGQHLEENSSIAVSVYSTDQEQMDEKRGLQVFGTAEKLKPETNKGRDAHSIYLERFESWKEFAAEPEDLKDLDSDFYIIRPERIKVFDEEKFSKETWINIDIKRNSQ